MSNGNPTDSFNGRIDEVRISNTALNTTLLLWSWAVPQAVRISAQPTTVAVEELGSATFSVSVSGRPPFSFQWFRADAPMAGATNAIYMLAIAQSSDHGTRFRVVVLNVSGGQANTATSSHAVLSVQADRTPPVLLGGQ